MGTADRSVAGDEHDLLAWLDRLTDAVEMLLRQSERQLGREAQEGFAAGEANTVLLREIERDQARELRADLRGFRSRYADRRRPDAPRTDPAP